MKKTIMILTNSDSGLYDFRKEILKELIAEGYRVIVSVPAGNYQNRIEQLGCEYVATAVNRRGMNPIKDAFLLMNYLRMLRKYRPDVVLTYTVKPNTYGCIACRILRIPFIVNITGLGTALENSGMVQRIVVMLYRIALKRARCVFFQNEYNQKFIKDLGCIHGKTRLLPGSGVNITEHEYTPYPDEEKEIRILDVMRIMRAKGASELLTVAPVIHTEFPRVIFEIAGSYEEESRAEYEPMIKDLQDRGILRYYGYREDIQKIMENSHIIINPSYSEGMSNVLLEAAATGRPVIATNINGCIEAFQDGITGISCDAKNNESLLRALRKMLKKSADERALMGRDGRTYVKERFNREIVVSIYLEEIAAAIKDKQNSIRNKKRG